MPVSSRVHNSTQFRNIAVFIIGIIALFFILDYTNILPFSTILSAIPTGRILSLDEIEYNEQRTEWTAEVVLGTGSTVYHIMKAIDIEKTLLGIDILVDGEIKYRDVNEQLLHELTLKKDVKILLTPIGGQGFLLGRGNQQISSRVLNGTSSFDFIVVSSEQKLTTIDKLEVDLEHPVKFTSVKNGYIKVLVGYHQYKLKKINIQVI